MAGYSSDIPTWNTQKASIENNFNRVFWTGSEYRSPGYSSQVDDRVNGWAVCLGLADSSKWPALRNVLVNNASCGPIMERYPEEALMKMGYIDDGLTRFKNRYGSMVNGSSETIWETWNPSSYETTNHGYGGAGVKLLSGVIAGVEPETAGYGTYHVFPNEGQLTTVTAVVPSVKGDISVSISKNSSQYTLSLTSPASTTAIVGIPQNALDTIAVNGTTIWQNNSYIGGVSGISYNSTDSKYIKFNANPGTWNFVKALIPSNNTVVYSGTDTTTQGSWKTVYGSDGYDIRQLGEPAVIRNSGIFGGHRLYLGKQHFGSKGLEKPNPANDRVPCL